MSCFGVPPRVSLRVPLRVWGLGLSLRVPLRVPYASYKV